MRGGPITGSKDDFTGVVGRNSIFYISGLSSLKAVGKNFLYLQLFFWTHISGLLNLRNVDGNMRMRYLNKFNGIMNVLN